MKHALVCLVLLVGAAVVGNDADLHMVIEHTDGTYAAAQLPLSDADLRGATHLWAWTTHFPPRRLDLRTLPWKRDRIIAELGRTPARSVEVRVRGWARPEELAFVRVIAAPVEMWGSVPEPLLPAFPVSKDGRVTITARDPIRLRVVGKGFGSMWEQLRRSTQTVDIALRRPTADAELTLQLSDRTVVKRAFATVMTTRTGDAAPVLQAQFASDDRGTLRIPALPESEVITLVVIAEGVAPQSLSGTASELSRTLRLSAEGKVHGRFVDEKNKPLEGVRAEVEGWISSAAPASSRSNASSDVDGNWVVGNLPRGSVIVRASSKGRSTFRRKVNLDGADVDLGTIPLLPSPDVTLTVSDTDDQRLSDVTVTSDSGFKGKTNDHGSVVLTGLASDEPTTITVAAKGFAKRTVHLPQPLPKEEHIVLERAFSIAGSLIDESGSLVSDATATVTIGTSYQRFALGSDGAFSFDVEAGKDFQLTFETSTTAAVTRTEVAGRAGEVRNLGSIRLPKGLSVHGRIVDSAEAPIAGARVWAVRSSIGGTVAAWVAGRVIQATSASDGSFDLRGLSPGPTSLRIDAADFARAHRDIVVVEDSPTDLGLIAIARGRTVTVTAPDDDADVARLDLRGEWLDADMLTAPVVDGKARLRNVPAGRYKVTVARGNAVVCERSVEVSERADSAVDCPPSMVVRGRVLLGDTPAYAGTLTWLRPSRTDALINNRVSEFGALQQRTYGVSGGTAAVPVRADGTFETDELRPGEWQVVWRSSDSAGTPERTITIPDAAEAQIVVAFSGGLIRGRVIDAQNQPVPAARIREIQGSLFAMAGSDGSFMLAAVPPGIHRLQATLGAKASRVLDVKVEAGKQTLEVTFEIDDVERNVLAIRVVGKDGEPKPNAFVFAEATGGMFRTLTSDAHGVATVAFPEGLPEVARVVAFAENSWAFAEFRRTREDDSQNAIVRFVPTGALMIRSRTISGAPVVLSSRAGDLTWMLARIGSFLSVSPESPLIIRGLPPGSYEVRLGSETASVAVTAGSTATLNLR